MKFSALMMSLCLVLSACATNQKSRLAATAVGVGVGAIVGAATAPEDERKELHALYWGGIIGVVAAVAANYYWNDEKDLDVMKLENDKLRAQLDLFTNGGPPVPTETRIYPANKKLFQSGKAKHKFYKIDQWKEEEPNLWYHRDQIMEVTPVDSK